jgi:hypothetical protein
MPFRPKISVRILLVIVAVSGVAAWLAKEWLYPDLAAIEIGHAIQAVDRYLAYRPPSNPTTLERQEAEEIRKAAVRAGQMTRLYPWVIGRLGLEIESERSWIRDTHPNPDEEKRARERIECIGKTQLEIDAPR